MEFIADFHIHSHFSRATSRDCNPENILTWAAYKGLTVVGTGDFTHPGWRDELRDKLEPAEEGLYRLKDGPSGNQNVGNRDGVRFVISGEISTIYKKAGRTRKIHHLILLPSLEAADTLSQRLETVGNIRSDGRPILGLDSRRLLEMTLEVCPQAIFIPAHIWTPHFSLFGSNSGFDAIEECFEDLTGQILAVETGLSSDPPMNWRLSALDRFALVSNSDAHSPANLAREANLFDTELSFSGIRDALKDRDPKRFLGTIEFFPEEGKYHYDGHRNCNIRWHPRETRAAGGICPVCGRRVTVGVLHRVEELADRDEGVVPDAARHYESLIPLQELIASALGSGPEARQVRRRYLDIINNVGSELTALRKTPLGELQEIAGPVVAEAIRRVREREVEVIPGFDGQYGKVSVMRETERTRAGGQAVLFAVEPVEFAGGLAGDKAAAEAATASLSVRRTSGAGAPLQAEVPPQAGAFTHTQPETPPQQVETPLRVEASSQGEAAPQVPHRTYSSLVQGLNPAQVEAVNAESGPVVVMAGPGTGKTMTLACRVAHLILEKGVPPEEITAVTFTNRAAAEMKARISALLGEAGSNRGAGLAKEAGPTVPLDKLTIGTFHGICLQILREEAGLTSEAALNVLDEFDSLSVLEEALDALSGDGRVEKTGSPQSRETGSLRSRDIQKRISLLKSRGIDADSSDVPPDLRGIYRAYQEKLREYGALDYDDILLETLRLMEQGLVQPASLKRFGHILVDEFQDVNPVQYRLVKQWARDGGTLFVIGDPDQAIYGFRGADHRFFARLREDFPGARLVELRINYRSTPEIVIAASSVIANNRDRFPYSISALRPGGPKIRYLELPGELSEGIAVVKEIAGAVGGTTMLEAHGQGGYHDRSGRSRRGKAAGANREASMEGRGFSDFAVLFRTSRQVEALEECFIKEGIPYRVVGREGFLQSQPVRDALSFMRCVLNPLDAFHRGRCLQMRLPGSEVAPGSGAVPNSGGMLKCPAEASLESLLARYQELSRTLPPRQLIARWAEEVGISEDEGIKRLLLVATRFPDLESLVSRVGLEQEGDALRPGGQGLVPEAVTLMTMHAAKGLEFPVVFVTGFEDGLIPLRDAEDEAIPEEERRLFYVAMTRAREELILLRAVRRRRFGAPRPSSPSPFLQEIPSGLLEREERPDVPKKGRREAQLRLFRL
ncbi:MAG TPA: UvrD-helicase domain-containing protein [Firmicutes bacterium]|nr:UvrD-helicase domain-containing protein [Bacillota bacterium]